MKKIRQKVFETNSSSTHVLTVSESSEYPCYENKTLIDAIEDGMLVFDGGEFGWWHEESPLNTSYWKANYVAVALSYLNNWWFSYNDNFFLKEVITDENILKVKNDIKNIFENLLKRETGCKDIKYKFTISWEDEINDDVNFACIDHQSVDELYSEFMVYHGFNIDLTINEDNIEKYLFDLIFRQNSYITISNDNN